MIPAGFRDFSLDAYRKKYHIIEIIKKYFVLYGYQPLETPAFEYLSTLTKKGGEEIKEQIFYFDDLGLRFDHTVPLMRFVSDHLELPKPFKRYAIGKVWRNEEPQKMRYREFTQADADIIGVKEIYASQELLEMTYKVFQELNLPITITINHKAFLEELAKDIEDKGFFFRTLDKMDRFGKEWVKKELSKKGINETIVDELEQMTLEDVKSYSEKAYQDLVSLPGQFNPFLVRGLDYYTGELFEIKTTKAHVSIGGGGRYDGMFGSDYNVGISYGVDRIYDIYPWNGERKGVFVAWVKEYNYAKEIANILRNSGIQTQLNLQERSLKKQLEYASKFYNWVIIVGPRDKEAKTLTLRNLKESKEKTIKLEEFNPTELQ